MRSRVFHSDLRFIGTFLSAGVGNNLFHALKEFGQTRGEQPVQYPVCFPAGADDARIPQDSEMPGNGGDVRADQVRQFGYRFLA
jgi:hypothetical protein